MNKEFLNKVLKGFSSAIEDDVIEVSKEEANFINKDNYTVIWKVNTGIYDSEFDKWLVEELSIYIAFNDEFPLFPPTIYFDNNDFEKLGFIPHITYLGSNICVFDEFVIVDDSRPVDIVLYQYTKAKKTLELGLKGLNDEDFEDEFIAYWETIQSKEDRLNSREYFTLIKEEPINSSDLKVLFYGKKNKEASYKNAIIYNKNENLIDDYIDVLKELNFELLEIDAFYINDIDTLKKPPFSITCSNSLELIPEDLKRSFKSFINSKRIYKPVIFKRRIGDISYFIGWSYPNFNKHINGFRKGKISNYNLLFTRILPNHKKSVLRFTSENINLDRLINRTSSKHIKNEKKSFLLSGIGSVGSNLLIQLNNFNFPNFTLIDIDRLGTENIGRHIFGFKDIGRNKVDIAKDFLKFRLPSQKVEVYNTSIIELINKNLELFNNQDFIFICIGKQNIDKWIIRQLKLGVLRKPVFIFWVEPFLLGGQCIFIHPKNTIEVETLFADVYKYKYSVINHAEYERKRDLFTLKESGCQSTYSPYSASHLSIFMSTIYTRIFEIISNNSEESISITWIGDTNLANELNVKLNFNDNMKYKLIENVL
ncbi:ThiF family adenylyltransferase [uncultured Winogradskyella sp.]|uniref:ThiF family adenylyltransferase n=1 Tax=uncultured Winogradskyella sp. TaxID=395353 RepID=UPI00260E542A|nr:ThiF family adenylyltransferase [uncultured Winogradskyella sp.]